MIGNGLMKMSRGDLMRQIHNDSIHSADAIMSARSSVVSEDDHQVTIMRRDGSVVTGERPQLTTIFGRENGSTS
ncbi:hypothetical protein Aduo_012385 [Ancylostoma duodenale]